MLAPMRSSCSRNEPVFQHAGAFCELRIDGVLRSSHSSGPILSGILTYKTGRGRYSYIRTSQYTPEVLWSLAGVGSSDRGSTGLWPSDQGELLMPGPIALKLRVLREE